jgi:hypothetical protein
MKQFLQRHTPYRNRYLCQYQRKELFSEELQFAWATKHEYLLDQTIDAALNGVITIACLAGTCTKVLGIDIDDHRGLGEEYLLNLYDQTVQKVGCNPSLLCKSPRGLHAYWYLGQYLPTGLLVDSARKELGKLPVEVRPSMTEALRVPKTGAVLELEPYTGTFRTITKPIEQYMETAPVYHYAELFGGELHSFRQTREQKKDRVVSLRKAESLYSIEAQVVPMGFLDGCSNKQFLELEQAYRCAGLSIEAALDRFKLVLDRSYGYTSSKADAISLKNIRKRLECTYKKNEAPKAYKPREVSLFNQTIIEDLIAKSPFSKQREKPLRRFLSELLAWCDWHDDILKDKPQTAVFDYYYKYYRKNRKEGYYPLPKNQLRKWNGHYNEIMQWLLKIGFLESSPYQYSKLLSICKYYRVHRAI